MAPLLLTVGPIITKLMSDRFEDLEPDQGLAEVRTLITSLVAISESGPGLDEARIDQVVALLTGDPDQDVSTDDGAQDTD